MVTPRHHTQRRNIEGRVGKTTRTKLKSKVQATWTKVDLPALLTLFENFLKLSKVIL